MTELEKNEILEELEKRFDKKYKGYLSREDTQSVLKVPREKWFTSDGVMRGLFGSIIYWQVWELIRKLTCIVCGKQYVRHLSEVPIADEVCEKICRFVFELKEEYKDKLIDTAENP